MKFLMAGGGTGGHVIPALAVAEELRSRGHEPVFFGTRLGYEARLVPAAGFPLIWIESGGLNRVRLSQRIRSLFVLPWSIAKVWQWIGRNRPGGVFSMGGYVAGPVVLAARLRGLPCVLMEPNAIPGLTNRRMAAWTARALVNFPETVNYFPPGRAEVTGVPVRQEFFAIGTRPRAEHFNILVTGGSQGSRTLNNAGKESWPLFAESKLPVRIIHQAGRGNAASLIAPFESSGLAGELVEFISDMPTAFAKADLIVCRAGASTVSELAAAGRASILVPFPYAADNHQEKNAEAMQRAGAAEVIADSDMTGFRFFDAVATLIADPERLREMGQNARKLAKPGAASRAADALEEVSA